MSYQEKKNIVNIVSSVVITAVYFWFVFRSHPEVGLATDALLVFWAKTMLWLIPVAIVSKIVIHIAFAILNAIATREHPPKTDERDRLIELKATRITYFTFSLGFLISMIAIASGFSVNVMFVILVVSGTLSEVFENLSQLYFYRRGI
ncbi:hypothetical protein E1176_05415 [Fulvivirga sp. RKSG066]|nr:hypothetical protein [Fulvivirga aurantia]